MSKEKPKSPFADVGDDADWDKALDAWEMGDSSIAPAKKPANAAPKPADPPRPAGAAPPAPPPPAAKVAPRGAAKPLYNPRSTDSLSIQPPQHRNSDKRGADAKEGAEDRAAGGSAEAADRASAPVRQGTGLGQALRGEVKAEPPRPNSQPLELAVEFSEAPSDGLMDALLEPRDSRSVVLSSRPDEPSVVTSAPTVDVRRVTIPEAERRAAMRRDHSDVVPEGGFYDPFAEQRTGAPGDDRRQTVRPEPSAESTSPQHDATSAVTPRLPPQDPDAASRLIPAIPAPPAPPRAADLPRSSAGLPDRGALRARLPKLAPMGERPSNGEEEPTVIKAAPPPRAASSPASPARHPQLGGLPGARPPSASAATASAPTGPGGAPARPSIHPPAGRPPSVRPGPADEGRASVPRPAGSPQAGPNRSFSPPPQAIRLDRLPLDSVDEIDRGQEALFEQMERSFGPSDQDTPGMRIVARRPGSVPSRAGTTPRPPAPPSHPPASPSGSPSAGLAGFGGAPARPARPGPSAVPGAVGAAAPTGSGLAQGLADAGRERPGAGPAAAAQASAVHAVEGAEEPAAEGAAAEDGPTSAPELTVSTAPSGSFAIENGTSREGDGGEPADSTPSVTVGDASDAAHSPLPSPTEPEVIGTGVIDSDQVAQWRERAEWLEAEADAHGDRAARARGLLLASELWAMAGHTTRAEFLAAQSRDLTPNALTHRQARTWALQNSRWTEVLEALQSEFRTATNPATRAHVAHFSAEIARVALKDEELAAKKLEQASRAWPVDARAHVWRIADALMRDAPMPKLRFPEGAELQAVSDALAKLQVWHGEVPGTPAEPSSIEALLGARAALSAGDLSALAACLELLGTSSGLREPAAWLMVAISLARPEERARATSLLNALTSGPSGTLAYRALAALAIDRGDADAAWKVLGEAPDGTFDPATKVVIAALASAAPQSLGETLQSLERDEDFRALSVGARAAIGGGLDSGEAGVGAAPDREPAVGSPMLRLGRIFGGSAPTEQLAAALHWPDRDRAHDLLASVLEVELDLEAGRIQAVAEKVASPPLSDTSAGDEPSRDHALLAALLSELTHDTGAARRLYEHARKLDLGFEAAARAQMACSDSAERPGLLLEQESATTDVTQGALLIVEAALSGTDPDTYAELLRTAHRKAPSIPFAAWLSERRARARGDFEAMVSWLRDRREVTGDAVEAAHDRVREALLIADEDPGLARQLLEQATNARPDDLAMRELYERLSPEQAPDWTAYWTAQAAQETGQDRARTELTLALEYERTGEYDLAAKAAREAVAAHDHDFGRITLDRMEARGPRAPDLTERLLTQIRASQSASERIELYQRLAALDESGQSGESSVPWYQAIVEEQPGHLASLCKLEHLLVSDGRDDDLAPVAAEIAKVATAAEAMAHAELAARFVARRGTWQATRPIVESAFERPECSLWALREMEAHAVLADDLPRIVATSRRLAERTIRPIEVAALSLRAAEASLRLHDFATARELLERVVELDPTNLVAQRTMAELCLEAGDPKRAAEATEVLAEHCAVPAHQAAAWYDAAVIWIDRASDPARGRTALERAADLDLTHRDTFERLQGVYLAVPDREALAELLEKRLALANTPEERVELEIVRGRTLAELGDREAAKRALAFALEQSPDHVAALAAFADVCGREEDWSGAEQAYIRLVRLIPEPREQADIYKKLGEIYSRHAPNLERAELAYNEVLRRLPEDLHAQEQLIDICERSGSFDRALELQTRLLHNAVAPEDKRRRTIELALVHERSGDARKAESILEAARKEFPNDATVLGALAEFLKRAGKPGAVQLLLDRAAGDARRALSTGRFDVNLFSVLAAVARLRDRIPAARIAEATVAALEGKAHEWSGVGMQPLDPSIDDLLAPDVLSPAFRALLAKSGEMLDAAAPVDLRALRAGPLTEPTMLDQIRDLAEPFGFESLEVFVSPVLGTVCVPVGSRPPQVVIGTPLLALHPEDRLRAFLVARGMKIVQARASALARSAPIELLPLVSAYLKALAPEWQPVGLDPTKLQDLQNRMQQARSQTLEDDVGLLALEVTNSLGNRMSTLNTLVYNWGNRLALLWYGDLAIAFQAIARAAGHATGPAASGPDRLTWIGRSSEARDLAIFSVSDAYAEARHRVGAAQT